MTNRIIIIAGPNGAGKTTFAEEFLPREADCLEFVNADLIAAGLSPFRPEHVAITAGRLMLDRIRKLAESGQSFAIETTLSSQSYLKLIPEWQEAGYLVSLFFLKLPDAEFAIRRVQRRVRLGGHDIPVGTIRRRFDRGWRNWQSNYRSLVDEWAVFDGAEAPPRLLQIGRKNSPQQLMEDSAPYISGTDKVGKIEPLDSPDFIGAEAAFKRAAANAIARSRAIGLEPVVRSSNAVVSDLRERE